MYRRNINDKTIEELENDFWIVPSSFPTELVRTVFLLRKKNLDDLNSNDIRVLISQNVGLKYVVSKGIDILKKDILHESLYYPGDLLSAILNIRSDYWIENPNEQKLISSLVIKQKLQFDINDENDEADAELINSMDKFLLNNSGNVSD